MKKQQAQIRLLKGDKLVKSSLPHRPNLVGETAPCAIMAQHNWHACRKPLIALPGAGRPKFPLPNVEQLIAVCVQHINQKAAEQRQRAAAAAEAAAAKSKRSKAEVKEEPKGINEILGDSVPPVSTVVPAVLNAPANGSTLYVAAGGMADMLYDGRCDAYLATIFDEPQGVEEWARKNMPPKFQKTVESLRFHWEEIYKLFVGERGPRHNHIGGALPPVMHDVQANLPSAS